MGEGVEMKQYTCVTKASKILESRQLILTLFVFQPILNIQGQFEGNKLNRRLGSPFWNSFYLYNDNENGVMNVSDQIILSVEIKT